MSGRIPAKQADELARIVNGLDSLARDAARLIGELNAERLLRPEALTAVAKLQVSVQRLVRCARPACGPAQASQTRS